MFVINRILFEKPKQASVEQTLGGYMNFKKWRCLLFCCFCLLAFSPFWFNIYGCSGGSGGGTSPAGSIPSTTDVPEEERVNSAAYDESKIVTVGGIGESKVGALKFPVNQLIVSVADGVTRSQIVALFEGRSNETLVGQIPSLGLYQIEVNTTTEDELKQKAEEVKALPEINSVTYNFLYTKSGLASRCSLFADISMLYPPEVDDIDPYKQTNYTMAADVVLGLHEMVDLMVGFVEIGVVEDGYNPSIRELSSLIITNASEDGVDLDGNDDHGTATVGLIGAQNNGYLGNGLLTSYTGDAHIGIYMARPRAHSEFSLMAAIERLFLSYDIQIVNLGVNIMYYYGNDEARDDYLMAIVEALRGNMSHLMQVHSNVLFVSSAAWVDEDAPANWGTFPGGIDAPNAITVSAWSATNPRERASGIMSLGDMSAPGENINVLDHTGTTMLRASGTSYSVPFVVSAAAMLEAVAKNSLSAVEVKDLLMHHHLVEQNEEGEVLLDFVNTLSDLLWQDYREESWGSRLMDANGDGVKDNVTVLEEHLCNSGVITIEEVGNYTLNTMDVCSSRPGMWIAQDGTNWGIEFGGFLEDNNAHALISLNMRDNAFAIGEAYELSSSNSPVPGVPSAVMVVPGLIPKDDMSGCRISGAVPGEGEKQFAGECTSGRISLTRCMVTNWDTVDGREVPAYLAVDGEIQCTAHGLVATFHPGNPALPVTREEKDLEVNGTFGFVTAFPITGSYFNENVEHICEGTPAATE